MKKILHFENGNKLKKFLNEDTNQQKMGAFFVNSLRN